MTRPCVVLLALMAMSSIGSAHACGQELGRGPATIPVGDRLRVAFRNADFAPLVGVLRGLHGDTLVLETQPDQREAVAIADVSGLEVYEGMGRRTLAGAAIGVGAGLAVVATRELLDSTCLVSDGVDCLEPLRHPVFLGGVSPVAVLGVAAILGAAVGAMARTDRWRPLPLSTFGVSVLVVARCSGLTVGLRVPTARAP